MNEYPLENRLARATYLNRLAEIENGLPVLEIEIYLHRNGDKYAMIGNNTGMIEFDQPKELLERFGKADHIEIFVQDGLDFEKIALSSTIHNEAYPHDRYEIL